MAENFNPKNWKKGILSNTPLTIFTYRERILLGYSFVLHSKFDYVKAQYNAAENNYFIIEQPLLKRQYNFVLKFSRGFHFMN